MHRITAITIEKGGSNVYAYLGYADAAKMQRSRPSLRRGSPEQSRPALDSK